MKKLLASVLVAAGLALAACATAPQSAAQAVYQVQGDYAAALAAAVAYKQLPPCTGTRSPLCSDRAMVARLQAADDTAFEVLSLAQRLVRSPGEGNLANAIASARAAVAVLVSVTATAKGPP